MASSKLISKETKLYFGKEYPENIRVQVDIREAVKCLKAKRWLDSQLVSVARKNLIFRSYLKILP